MKLIRPTIYALHGFLGRPEDWSSFLWPDSFSLMPIDVFNVLPINDMPKWAEQFNEHVQEKSENCSPRVLMGYSLGGRLALHALLHLPDLWSAAVIISAHTGLTSSQDRQKRLLEDSKWADRFMHDPWNQLMNDWNAREAFKQDRFCFQRFEANTSRVALASALNHWSLGHQEDLTTQLSQVDLPILWIAGGDDKIYLNQMQRLSFKHSLSKTWIAENAGHRAPWQKPSEFLLQIKHFLSQCYC